VKKTGLFFGSFNPIHIGHLIVAEHFLTEENLDEIWFIISPQNPLKQSSELAAESHRLEMVRLAIQGRQGFFASDVEFHLDRPSYTYLTLRKLTELHPDRSFVMVLGDDIRASFHKWKEYSWILENFEMLFYPRNHDSMDEGQIEWEGYRNRSSQAPRVDISSTLSRRKLSEGKSIRYLVTENVADYILRYRIYEA
jgi:nicotinate-nucleotide adenylyltransferase